MEDGNIGILETFIRACDKFMQVATPAEAGSQNLFSISEVEESFAAHLLYVFVCGPGKLIPRLIDLLRTFFNGMFLTPGDARGYYLWTLTGSLPFDKYPTVY